jgi:hypothetical protein
MDVSAVRKKMTKEELLDQLATLSLKDIKSISEEAIKQSSIRKKESIPQEVWDDLYRKQKRLDEGQKVIYRINVPIQIVFTAKAEWEYGTVSDYKMSFPTAGLSASEVEKLKKFEDTLGKSLQDCLLYASEDCSLANLDNRISNACQEETAAYDAFNNLRRQIENELDVDPWPVLKSMEADNG